MPDDWHWTSVSIDGFWSGGVSGSTRGISPIGGDCDGERYTLPLAAARSCADEARSWIVDEVTLRVMAKE